MSCGHGNSEVKMEAVKKRDKALATLKKEFEEGKLILGMKRTLKLLRKNKIEKIYLSATYPKAILEREELKNIKVEEVSLNSSELGKYLGKSFPVAVIGVAKNENVR